MGKSSEKFNYIQKAYVTPDSTGAFGGVLRLANKVKEKVNYKDVETWLKKQDVYTLFRQVKRNFPRLPILVKKVDEQWQIDLMDMSWVQKENDGFRYLLNVIDCLSRYAWSIPLRRKNAEDIIVAMEDIFKQGRVPEKIQSDQGKEFVNEKFKSLCNKYNVNFFTSTDDVIKCAIVERFNRTLRTRIYRYLYFYNTHKYIDVIKQIITSYNKSYHRTIQMAPQEVTKENTTQVLINIRKQHPKNNSKQTALKVGDKVRITRGKGVFEKGSTTNFTEEIFQIYKVKKTPQGYVYRIKDYDGEEITSVFYHYELAKVDDRRLYKIEKVLKTRNNPKTGKKEIFVKWLGYPSKFNSWTNYVKPT